MVDIKKLEKLSCLQLSEDLKGQVATSIDGVMSMIKEIEELDTPILQSNEYRKTELSENYEEKLYSRDNKVHGVHLEDRMFLAPKVIKK